MTDQKFVRVATHSVTYEIDGGSELAPTQENVKEGDKFKVQGYTGTRTGYTFGGWSWNGNEYKADDEIEMGESDIVLKAIWNLNAYTITFYPDNGAVSWKETYSYGATITKPGDPVRQGHTFRYWKAADGTEFDFENGTMPDNDITLTAVWTVNEYPINIEDTALTVKDGDGNKVETGTNVAYGTVLTVETEARLGYTPVVKLNGNVLTGNTFTVGLTNALTVEYTITQYTVKIAVNGNGSVDSAELKIPHGTAASVKGNVLTIGEYTITATPSDEDHSFAGWSDVPDTVTSNLTITASFFDDDGKAEIETDKADIIAEKTGSTTTITAEIKTDVADVDAAITETLDKIDEVKAASGSSDKNITVKVIVPVEKGSVRLSISATTVSALKDSGASLTVINGDAAVSLDADAIGTLKEAAVASGDELSIEVTPDPIDLSSAQKKVIGENKAVDVSAFLGEEKVSKLGGKATISIPYVTDKKVKVTYVMDNGKTEDVACTYADGIVSFVTTHFSVYMISEFEETVPVVPDTDGDYYPIVPTVPTGTSNSDDNGDVKTIVACAAAAVAAALAAAFFIIDSRRS